MSLPHSEIGVYAIWYRKWCIYVGKAKDQGVSERLEQHWSRCHNKLLKLWITAWPNEVEFCWISLPSQEIDNAEKILIKQLRPNANIKMKGV